MAKYKVYYEQSSYLYAEVEANSPEEAYEIAEEMDGGEFTEDICSAEWRYVGAELITENNTREMVWYDANY